MASDALIAVAESFAESSDDEVLETLREEVMLLLHHQTFCFHLDLSTIKFMQTVYNNLIQ